MAAMKDKLRFAVIGAGGIGLHHLASIQSCPRAELVAIAETNPQRAKKAVDRFPGIRIFTDYRKLLRDDGVDAVSIALPNYLHAPVALAALRAGKHVHLDKPFALSARQAAAVIAAARKARRVFMVGQNWRFTPDAQTLKLLIDQGALGEIYHGRAWYIRRSGIPRIGSWFTQKKYAGGGVLLDIGVHILDAALYLMNNFLPVSVTGFTHAKFGPHGQGNGSWGLSEVDPKAVFDVEDYAGALIKLRGGQTLFLEVAWAAHLPEPDHGIQLFGTEGGGRITPARIYRRSAGLPAYEVVTPENMPLPYPTDRLHHFADCVLDGKPPMVRPEQSLAVQRILDALYKSAATGREVRL